MVQSKIFYGQGEIGLKEFEKDLNQFMAQASLQGFEYKGLTMSTQYIPVNPSGLAAARDVLTIMPLFIATLTYEVGNHMAGAETNVNEDNIVSIEPGKEV